MLYRTVYPYFDAVVNFIYPHFCVVCKNRLEPELNLICQECWQSLPRLKHVEADLKSPHITRFLAIWEFNDAIQRLIHEIKFFGKKSLAKPIGEELAKTVSAESEFMAADWVIPVPLHRTKLRERGFNQSLLLSEQISERTGIPVNEKALRRIRYTKPQSKLTAIERDWNVRGAFKVKNSDELAGKKVILVDDVLTTGSTMKACAEALKSAGVRKVLALTAAATLIDSA